MRKLILSISALLFLGSCAPAAYKASDFNLKDSNFHSNDYRIVFFELWHTQESARKISWEIMPPGNKAFAISQYGVYGNNSFSAGGSFVAFSSKSLEDAKNKSLAFCKSSAKEGKYLFTGKVDPETCKVFISDFSTAAKKSSEEIQIANDQRKQLQEQAAAQQKMQIEYDRYIQQCEYIGFQKNTDKIGECVLQMYNTEIKLAQLNMQQRSADSSDVLTNMFLLNESLKLLNPPRPQTKTCQAIPTGNIMNIYCN